MVAVRTDIMERSMGSLHGWMEIGGRGKALQALRPPPDLKSSAFVEDGKYMSATEEPEPAVFIAYAQGIGEYVVSSPITVLVRSPMPQDQIIRELHHAPSQIISTGGAKKAARERRQVPATWK
jgi:hypothetical protein